MADKILEMLDELLPGDLIMVGALASGCIAYALSGHRSVLVYLISLCVGFFVPKILRSLH
jgi:hypothetical protein